MNAKRFLGRLRNDDAGLAKANPRRSDEKLVKKIEQNP